MRRRTFLKWAGVTAGMSTMHAGRGATVEAGNVPENTEPMFIDAQYVQDRNQNRSTMACCRGMVCAGQPLAASAGLDILKAGGNAIDAAIAANAVMTVTAPMSCGVGGDLFAIVWRESDKKLYGLNASGRAPYEWTLKKALDMGLDEIPSNSPLSWSVPGCVSGWQALLERFGSKPFAELLEPARYYANAGFPVSPVIANYWRFDGERFPKLAEVFGASREFGEIVKQPLYARTLSHLMKEGPEAFYQGVIAERIVQASKDMGGHFTMRDLEEHTADWIDPVSAIYRGYDVWELPPNGQGIAALQILNLLEHFDIAALDPNSARHLHLFLEAKKLAFEDRAMYYADPEFAKVPVEWLISKEYAAKRVQAIDSRRASNNVNAGQAPKGGDTIYLCAADAEGNMVSLIQSVYAGWGSKLMPEGLGFAIQNRGELFALDPKHANRLEPHKRPFHTIIPAFVTKEGRPKFAYGVMGGDFQPQGHAQVLMNLVDFGMSPQQAGEHPRIMHSGSSTPTGDVMQGGGAVHFEQGFPDAVKVRLAEMGHAIQPGTGAFGGYQGIWREDDPKRYFGGSDSRKDGCAIGY